MKSILEIETDIINITMKINSEYPELSKFINEMPINNKGEGDDSINIKNTKEYYNSLVNLLKEYSNTHKPKK